MKQEAVRREVGFGIAEHRRLLFTLLFPDFPISLLLSSFCSTNVQHGPLWQPLAAVAHGHCRPETMELIDACRRTIATLAGAQGSGMGGSRVAVTMGP